MIARIWTGRVRAENKEVYVAYVRETGMAAHLSTEGNQGSMIMTRLIGDTTEIKVLSLWDSYDSIRKFAGEDFETAVYYPEDEKYLLDFPEHSEHHEVGNDDYSFGA